jgi:ketopantoate reductase
MPGVANISATIAEPGLIRQTGTVMRMVFGEPDGSRSPRAVAFAEMCKKYPNIKADQYHIDILTASPKGPRPSTTLCLA